MQTQNTFDSSFFFSTWNFLVSHFWNYRTQRTNYMNKFDCCTRRNPIFHHTFEDSIEKRKKLRQLESCCLFNRETLSFSHSHSLFLYTTINKIQKGENKNEEESIHEQTPSNNSHLVFATLPLPPLNWNDLFPRLSHRLGNSSLWFPWRRRNQWWNEAPSLQKYSNISTYEHNKSHAWLLNNKMLWYK